MSAGMKWLLSTPEKSKTSGGPPGESFLRSLKRRSLRLRRPKHPVQEKRKSDSFVNSQEWTVSRCVPDLRLGIVGSLSSGKSALVHRYLTGSYMQEESPEGGRFKKEVLMDGHSHLLLIRDEGGPPELQFSSWVDAVIFVFSLENEASFNAVYSYYTKMSQYRNTAEIPLILVGTQDAISESRPRVIDDGRARKLASDLKRCSYYETCATYGLNVERVFQDACQKIVQQRLSQSATCLASNSRPTTPLAPLPPPQIVLPSSPSHHHTANHKESGLSRGQCLSSSSHALHKELAVDNNNISKLPTLDNLTLNPGMPCKDLPTPSSTPTATRKNRRRSNLFTPSKKGDEKLRNGGEVGSGRAIPVKQGSLYKRSSKTLNKEWKKKYVTLCDDGRLTYHPSLHDYMENVHGKEIPLQYVTVKVPGQKPRGSKTITQSNGSSDALSSITNFHPKDKKNSDKVTLTSYEIIKEPGRIIANIFPSNEDSLIIPPNPLANGTDCKAETPNVKKRHRRIKSSSVKNHDCDDTDGYEFLIVSLDKQWHFEASSYEEREEWVAAIENQILNTLQGVESSKGKLRLHSSVEAASIQSIRSRVPGNMHCADCDAPNPDWASLNLGILLCIECSGIHRNLGSHISKVRSLHLDEWPAGHLSVMLSFGNSMTNSIWEAQTDGRCKPTPSSSREEKERWAWSKYVGKEFLKPLENHPRQHLIDSVCRSDMKGVAEALAQGEADLVNATVSAKDTRTPLHLACAMGNLPLAQLLIWHNADVMAIDNEGRSCLSFARGAARSQPEVSPASSLVDLLVSMGCTDLTTLPRKHTPVPPLDRLPSSVI